jgi:hypothetical protein
MSFGKVFFARNNTGVKLGFTNLINIEDAVKRLNISHVPQKFKLCNYILVKNPKSVKSKISDEISHKKIHIDLFNISEYTISRLCDKYGESDQILNLDMNSDYDRYREYFDYMIHKSDNRNK